ncbi:MAG TPA: sugar transferase [Deltaproteobacteria bacterium]|nr:sugar transferase [Deltaproteobacteria bacterium]
MGENNFYSKYGKRIFDFTVAFFALILFSPLLFITACLVRLRLGSPVIFRQERLGLKENPFVIMKFRTMTDAKDENGNMLPDAERLTRFGALLRRASIDELPELINVLKGDMSIVGPRPLFMHYLPYYTERERLRHTVRPGITGLSQVSGRNYLPWDERLETDVQYVEKMSFLMDLQIMLKTIVRVLNTKDVAVLPGTVSVQFSQHRAKYKNADKKEE